MDACPTGWLIHVPLRFYPAGWNSRCTGCLLCTVTQHLHRRSIKPWLCIFYYISCKREQKNSISFAIAQTTSSLSTRPIFTNFWWNQELNELKANSVRTNNVLKAAGKPRTGPIFMQRQTAKAAYKASRTPST